MRTPKGHVHGIENKGAVPFGDLTVTCPPEDVTGFYEARHDPAAPPADAGLRPTVRGD